MSASKIVNGRAVSRVVGAAIIAGLVSVSGLASAADPKKPASSKARDPNEKVCETQQVLGSRLAVRRVCATRAEWADRRAQEREMVGRTQVQQCVIDPATGVCS